MSSTIPEPDPTLSRDATFSTYAEADDVDESIRPAPGPSVIQTRGVPVDVSATKTTATKTSSTSTT